MITKRSTPADERVWRALADGTRRAMLDALSEQPLLTGDLVDRFPQLCRTGVMKHLAILVEADLVIIRREGRRRWNHLNPLPIQRVCDRWVSRHVRGLASAMSRLKDHVEKPQPPATKESTMTGAVHSQAGVAKYELEVEIDADPDRVWQAMFEEINAWWLPDFHMVAPGSKVRFDARAGGGLIEESADGASLLWYTVHWIRPAERTVYLVGHVAPDWGGPAVSHLKFAVQARGGGSVLRVSDAHFGHVSEANLGSLQEGWTALFRDGLKQFVESGNRRRKS